MIIQICMHMCVCVYIYTYNIVADEYINSLYKFFMDTACVLMKRNK